MWILLAQEAAQGISGFQMLCLVTGGGALAAGCGWFFRLERSNAQLRSKMGIDDGNGLIARLDHLQDRVDSKDAEGREAAKELRREISDLKVQLARIRTDG